MIRSEIRSIIGFYPQKNKKRVEFCFGEKINVGIRGGGGKLLL
jgi:hypothetical protein